MVGQKGRWRIRVDGAGGYRIVYEIPDDQLLVLVVTVAHRREVYR
jgi:mRNA interferase RelE/StbE